MITKKTTLVAAALLGLTSGCANQVPTGVGPGGDLGKADDPEPAIAVTAANESLFSVALRARVCDAVSSVADFDSAAERQTFEDDCQTHAFTVTEKRISTLFAHQEGGDPITLGMTVRVDDGTHQWEASLDRVWRPSTYRFVWEATPPEVEENRDDYIRMAARDGGEWIEADGELFRAISIHDVPNAILETAQDRAEMHTEEWRRDDPDTTDGAVVEPEQMFEILRDGEVVGYAIGLGYWIDAPLFDGGGEMLYINMSGRIIDAQEWWG